MTRKPPVVIVGGGVIGLCTAHYLARSGTQVCVIDDDPAIPPASWGNAGWVVPALSAPLPAPGVMGYGVRALARPGSPLRIAVRPDPRFAAWLWSFARHCTRHHQRDGWEATIRLIRGTPELFDDLADHGVEFDMWEDGLTFVALDRPAAEGELERLRPLGRHGYRLPAGVLDGDELREQEPALSAAVRAGFHLDGQRHVDPRTFLEGLRRGLRDAGAILRDGAVATRCVVEADRVTGVVVGGETVPASAVVLAAGAWTGRLAAQLGCRIPMQAGKGYSFATKTPPQVSRPLKLLEGRVAITPFRDHTRMAGTMEFDGLRPRVKRGRLTAIHATARRYLDGWDDATPLDTWVGLRPMTPDGLPVIGSLPGLANAYVASGHAMLGVTLGPATGKHLADLILTGETEKVIKPFTPGRFHRR